MPGKGARTVADDPVAESAAPDAEKKPKYKRPPTIGDRRRLRGENVELEMIAQLGDQARGILKVALTAEHDENFSKWSDYLAFREKISEFEAFCNVIESHLKEIVSDRKPQLEERFYRLWSMIFRPSLTALTKFFARMGEADVLPLGGRDMLESELRALQSMRTVLAAPRFNGYANEKMLAELTQLEAVIAQLSERSTSLPDFSKRGGVDSRGASVMSSEDQDAEDLAPSSAPSPAAPTPLTPMPPRATGVIASDMPNVKAVRELKGLLEYYKRDKALRQYVDIDTRAVDEIERKLLANPMDPAAVVWMRQICNAWASRLRDNDKDVRKVLAMIRSP
jgi:hypothetical protein